MRAMLNRTAPVPDAAAPVEMEDERQDYQDRIAELESVVAYQAEVIAQLQACAAACPLTGLANRAALENELAKSLSNAKRHDRRHGLLLLQLDGLASLEKTLEPVVMQGLLQHVARLIRQNIRPTDVAAHLEDHTFVVILNELKVMANAQMRADQLAETLRNTPYIGASRSVGVIPVIQTRLVTAGDTVRDLLLPLTRPDTPTVGFLNA
jgi:diguanylate cyclase (GGDEF)-like protein